MQALSRNASRCDVIVLCVSEAFLIRGGRKDMRAQRYHYNLPVLILFIVCLLGLGEVKCMDCHIIVKWSRYPFQHSSGPNIAIVRGV
jgi:hypothetical protein